MKLKLLVSWYALIALLVLFVITPRAYAYVDPGAGGYFLQILLAGFFAFMFLARKYFRLLLAWITKPFRKPVSREKQNDR